MRLLHSWDNRGSHGAPGQSSTSDPGRCGRGPLWKSVPLRRVYTHHRSSSRRGGQTVTEQTIGRSIPRFGAIDRVTGAQRYTADIHLENALQVKLLSLPCARARILSIDASAA